MDVVDSYSWGVHSIKVEHCLSEVKDGAFEAYSSIALHVVRARQTLSKTGVAGMASYSEEMQLFLAVHSLSLVKVGGADSRRSTCCDLQRVRNWHTRLELAVGATV